MTHKFNISGHEGYITVGLYPNGRPGEMFITMAKEGSTIGGLMDCFGTAVSMSLQYGVPLEVYVNKFSHTRFEPMGFTKNPDIKIAKSIVDYIFRWLGIAFLPGYREANKMPLPLPADAPAPGAHGSRALARRHDGRRAARGPRIGEVPSTGARSKSEPEDRFRRHERQRPTRDRQCRCRCRQALPKSRNPEIPKSPTASAPGYAAVMPKVTGLSPSGAAGPASAAAPKSRNPEIPKSLLVTGFASAMPAAAGAATMLKDGPSPLSRSEQFAAFQTDAPACDNCGAITVRNGNCYLCYNCGSSMGCS